MSDGALAFTLFVVLLFLGIYLLIAKGLRSVFEEWFDPIGAGVCAAFWPLFLPAALVCFPVYGILHFLMKD